MFSGKIVKVKFIKIRKYHKYWQLVNKCHLSAMFVRTRLAIATRGN